MNKKIYKGYELAETVDNGILSLEQKVKNVDNMTYFECTIGFVLKDVAKNIMFEYFELLEDNTEEIEELDEEWTYIEGQVEKTWGKSELELVNKINELVRAVKQLDKKIKEK